MKGSRTWRKVIVACGVSLGVGWNTTAPAQPAEQAARPVRPLGYGEVSGARDGTISGRTPMPIDLPTALRLANASNPTINLARARVQQAYARLTEARVLWLPSLTAGTAYLRHDGQIQNSRGEVFPTSRSSIYTAGGAQMRFDTADALFLPLVARRLTQAESANAQAASNNIQLDTALAYLDLLQVHGALAVNADTLARAEQMLDRAEAADKAGISKTKADLNRAATEVQIRREERINLRGRSAVASARLARLLLLDPTVDLIPADTTIVPIVLLPPTCTLDDLVALGLSQRPELASAQATRSATEVRVRQARVGPLIPKVQIDYLAGGFGGGRNDDISNFDGRGDAVAQAYWELRNLGIGYRAQVRERQAVLEQANFHLIEVQAQVAAEITEAAKLSGARFAALDNAQKAVQQGVEMYRKLQESSFGMIGPRPQYDAIEPLLAIQALNQARVQYLNEVVEFDRAQFRLFTALGQPPLLALPQATASPVDVPVSPSPEVELPKPRPAKKKE